MNQRFPAERNKRMLVYRCIVILQLVSCYLQDEIKYISIPRIENGKHIYTLYTIKKTWNEAYDICLQNEGGRLITVSSPDVLSFIKEQESSDWSGLLTTDYWIGLSEGTEGVFLWQDCSYSNPLSGFSHFKGDGYKADELCYCADISQEHKWANAKCTDTKIFICENIRDCDLRTTMISHFYFESFLTTEEACNGKCEYDRSCWGAISLGKFGCSILKVDNATANGVVKFSSKSCSHQALLVNDQNAIPGVVDSSLIPKENCSLLNATETMQPRAFPLATPTPYLSTEYFSMSTSSYEMNTCSNNITVTEIQINTEIISVTNFINIVSTVYDIHQEYITVSVTSLDELTTSCSCLQSVYENTVNCSNLVTQTANCSSSYSNIMKIDNFQLQYNLESIRKELVVYKNTTSAYHRRFISVVDSRYSATAIGYAGAIFLTFPILVILASDLPKFIRSIRNSISSYRE